MVRIAIYKKRQHSIEFLFYHALTQTSLKTTMKQP